MIFGALLGVALAAGVFAQDTLSPDYACRGCHDEMERGLTLPSGEELPLRIDLAALDASPHGHDGEQTVYCTSCHAGEARYLYPHAPNPAQTQTEFTAALADACASCHYPHLPFHDAATMTGVLPTCGDCHGSHAIARVEAMGTAMAPNCLACHTDQTPAWAAEFVASRPGMGAGAADYAGSARCNGCHDDLYFTWHDTLHANVVRDPATDPQAIVADFTLADPDLTFGLADVRYVIGGKWRQVFLADRADVAATAAISETAAVTATVTVSETAAVTATATVSETAALTPTTAAGGELVLLPAQWTVATGAWEPLSGYGDGVAGEEWLAACAGCHVTGLDAATGGFTEFGVGCESCHGPAAAHAADPENVKPYAQMDDQVCGACHSRGESPDGHPYPITYRPGDELAAHFTASQDAAAVWPDGSARRNHQQYMDWNLGSSMAQAEDTGCITCHQMHGRGATDAQLLQPVNELCLSCHNEQRAWVRHTPFHEKALKERAFLCTDCHMPKLASGAQAFDLHNHSLLQPNPQGSVDHGGLEAMPNACNTCHIKSGESPQWANEIVAYAAAQATPSAARFFGPGPTPTSPPPPTPVSSVGQRAEPELTPPGWWIRWLMYGVVVLLALWLVVWLVNRVRPRRTLDA